MQSVENNSNSDKRNSSSAHSYAEGVDSGEGKEESLTIPTYADIRIPLNESLPFNEILDAIRQYRERKNVPSPPIRSAKKENREELREAFDAGRKVHKLDNDYVYDDVDEWFRFKGI